MNSSRSAWRASSNGIELGSDQPGPDGLAITDQLQAIHERTRSLVDDAVRVPERRIAACAAPPGNRVAGARDLGRTASQWLEQYFEREVEPVLSPIGLDPARPFPRILNKSLNFIVRLAGKDAFGRDTGLAIVQAPRSLPRVIALPEGRRAQATSSC